MGFWDSLLRIFFARNIDTLLQTLFRIQIYHHIVFYTNILVQIFTIFGCILSDLEDKTIAVRSIKFARKNNCCENTLSL